MISYSPQAARALGYLKRIGNDVEIFVEDSANPNMWTALIRRALPAGTKLRSVNVLGCRDKVIKACELDQAEGDGRRKLYIIDGDFDIALKRRKPRLKHLYRLKSYCIENVLLSKGALSKICMESLPQVDEVAAFSLLKYDRFFSMINRWVRSIFLLYATAHKLAPSIQTTGYSVHKLLRINKSNIGFDKTSVYNRKKFIIEELGKIRSKSDIICSYKTIRRSLISTSAFRFASGKDYILPILYLMLRNRIGYRGTIEQLKVRLAGEFSRAAEPYLWGRIQAI